MIDRLYLKNAIERIEQEKLVHDKEFAEREIHKNCLSRFDDTLARLRSELEKLENELPAAQPK